MDYLYSLSIKDVNNEFRDLCVHSSVEAAFFSMYSYMRQEGESLMIDDQDIEMNIKDLQDMDKMNLFDQYDRVTLFDKFRVTRIQNRTTAKFLLEQTLKSIDESFETLRCLVTKDTVVCFPVDLISSKTEQEWQECDPVNSQDVIKHLHNYLHIKINELSILHNINVIRKDCCSDSHTATFFPVTLGNGSDISFFTIIVSPGGGYHLK